MDDVGGPGSQASKAISAMESGPLLLYRPVFGCLYLDFEAERRKQVSSDKNQVGEYTYYILHTTCLIGIMIAPYGNTY